MDLISSRSNQKIKAVRALRHARARREQSAFLVEGIRHVGEAIEAGVRLQSIYYSPELLSSAYALELVRAQSAAGVPCFGVSADVFRSLAEKENPQGILAVAWQFERTLDELSPQNLPWGVALVAPQDPGNLGTILRTMDAVGASGLLMLDQSVDLYHPTVVRASMGALFRIPVVQATFEEFSGWISMHPYHVYGTSAHGDSDYRAITYRQPCILLMGSEREGLSQDQIAVCREFVRLPMHGRVTSLNLAVATGIMLYAMKPEGTD